MRVIVDHQQPPLLAEWFRRNGLDAHHVRDLGLATASDQLIWDEASRDDAVVISRDDDFVTLARTRGGARLVWVRVGNCSNPVLVATIEANWPAVAGRLSDGERLVELRA